MNMVLNETSHDATSMWHKSLDYLFQGYWAQKGDPRVEPLFFMQSFAPPLAILMVWAVFVKLVGPQWMERRKPFSLKSTLLVYNLMMSLSNGYFLIRYFLLYNYGMDAFNVNFPSFEHTDAKIDTIIWINHLYMLSKFIDLLDTVFFVLRKKNNQVTFLHFYHHLTVPFICWTYFRLCGNNAYFIPFQLMNSAVHTLMYGYYGLAAIGPFMQPYLWWKRYITQLQIVQFILLFLYGLYFSAFQRGYDSFYSANMLFQSALYVFLFGRFYLRTYEKEEQQKRVAMKTDLNNNQLSSGQTKVKSN